MPTIGAILKLSTSVRQSPETVHLNLKTSVRNEDLVDFLTFSTSVTGELAVAVAASSRLLGMAIEIDEGAGLRLLARGEVGPQLTATSSLEGYGGSASFTRSGSKLTPFLSDSLRAMRRVRITGYLGTSPATMQPRVILDGYQLSGSFDALPDLASITAQDGFVVFANKKLALDIPDGSNRTRLNILSEVIESTGIPPGSLDLGPDEGGIVRKGMSIGGDVYVLDWIREYVGAIGCRLQFRGLLMDVGRFDERRPPIRSFGVWQLANLRVTPPITTESSQVSVSGTAFVSSTETPAEGGPASPPARSMSVTDVATTGDYVPVVATKVQSHTDGAITDRVFAAPPHEFITDRTVTTNVVEILGDGGVVVTETIDKYGWYAQRAAQFSVVADPAGALSFNHYDDVYLFPDGSARAVERETFQRLTRTVTTRAYTAGAGILYLELIISGAWAPDIDTTWDGLTVDTFENKITAAHEKWNGGVDLFVEHLFDRAIHYNIAADGVHLASIYEHAAGPFTGSDARVIFDGYTYLSTGDPASAKLPTTLQGGPDAVQYAAASAALNEPQALTGRATDGVRVALCGLTTENTQDNFCENLAELQRAALFRLRELSKLTVEFDAPVDLMTRPGEVVTLPIPQVGSGDYPILVHAVDLSIDGGTAENSMHVTGAYYPPNLRLT